MQKRGSVDFFCDQVTSIMENKHRLILLALHRIEFVFWFYSGSNNEIVLKDTNLSLSFSVIFQQYNAGVGFYLTAMQLDINMGSRGPQDNGVRSISMREIVISCYKRCNLEMLIM